MWTRHKKRSFWRHAILPLFTFAALAYFSFHAFHGKYGLKAMESYTAELADLQREETRLDGRIAILEHRTSLLRDGTIEKDMVDEQARRVLGLSRPNDIILTGDTVFAVD
jgi:cell division protein FtsB